MALSREGGVRWLRSELPALVASGVITDESARSLERHYGSAPEHGARRFGFVLLAVIGSALVAAGIILLIAHNWDEFSRPLRSIIAFLPLLAAQGLTAFVFLRRDESKPWRESAAIFNVAGIGAAIAIVSQTYQIHGSFEAFVLTWLLLALPLVYLLRSTIAASAYVIGAIVWLNAPHIHARAAGPLPFWLLLGLVLPYAIIVHRRHRQSQETTLLWIVIAIGAAFGLGYVASFARAHLALLAFSGLFTAVYLCGMELFPRPDEERLHPLAWLGALAIGGMAIVLTFEEAWRSGSYTTEIDTWARVLGIAIQLVFPVLAVGLAAWSLVRGGAHFSYLAAAFPVVVGVGWLAAHACYFGTGGLPSYDCGFGAAMLFNVYALALGVELIARGIHAQSTLRANFGLLVIAALAIARFFDSDLSFVVRALGFIVIGVGFLFTNLILFRKRTAT